MFSILLTLAVVGGAFGTEMMWDPTGQYRLVPKNQFITDHTGKLVCLDCDIPLIKSWDQKIIMEPKTWDQKIIVEPKSWDQKIIMEPKTWDQKVFVEPKSWDQRIITEQKVVVDPWKQYLVGKQYVLDTLPRIDTEKLVEQKIDQKLVKMVKKEEEEKKKEILKCVNLDSPLCRLVKVEEDKKKEEEDMCMKMGGAYCTKDVIERIKEKSPMMLEELCKKKGMGCMELRMLPQFRQFQYLW